MPVLSTLGWRTSAGETFDQIALHVYGKEKYATQLIAANPEYAHLDMFTGREVLRLPVVTIEKPTDSGGYAPSKAPWREV